MDMLGRELQQMTPMTATTYFTNTANPATAWSNTVNFYVDIDPHTHLTWPLLGRDTMVTAMDRLLFVTRYNQQWSAIGYKVDPNRAAWAWARFTVTRPPAFQSQTSPFPRRCLMISPSITSSATRVHHQRGPVQPHH